MKTIKKTNRMPSECEARFLTDHWHRILKFALCHMGKNGYVRAVVNKDYTLESIRFIEVSIRLAEEIDQSEFRPESVIIDAWDNSLIDLFYLFYEIFYKATKTRKRFCAANYTFTVINPAVYNPQ